VRASPVAALIAGLLGAPVMLRAQQADGAFIPVDRIAAVVGETPIPLSRVDEELNLWLAEMQRAGRPVPQDSAALMDLRRELLQRLIDEELLVQQARRDTTVQIGDQQVHSSTEAAIRQTRSQFSSDFEFRRQLQLAGLGTPDEYRRMLSEQVRRRLLSETFIQRMTERGDLRDIPPTEDEVRAQWERTRGEQPRRPATVSARQIVIRPQPTPEAKAAERARADSVLRELRAGADFATAARRLSDDPGTKEDGGDLGWFRRGRMVREFEQVAFALRPGHISEVVESPFGFHLIQVERVEPAEVKARHILFAPAISDSNRAAARALADSVATALNAGAPFDSLLRLHHDPLEQSLFDGVAQTDLPPTIQTALAASAPGEIVGPIELTDGERVRYSVIRFDERLPEGEYGYEELRDRIRSQLMRESGVRRYLQELRRRVYIDVRI
jgi:peptidyl-prolyl cis-trans isomerase SurA